MVGQVRRRRPHRRLHAFALSLRHGRAKVDQRRIAYPGTRGGDDDGADDANATDADATAGADADAPAADAPADESAPSKKGLGAALRQLFRRK